MSFFGGSFGPEQEWDRTAIELEADIWAARPRPDACTQDERLLAHHLAHRPGR
ncbi:hypothetical protein ACPPVO_44345 [Dactylosporangium sp. McL0621]|uniref:hypothetical protein n=1 Tax=Dactylosporangium sp. McL0621 TaxID=3415678 RepID=UPI003CE8AF1E